MENKVFVRIKKYVLAGFLFLFPLFFLPLTQEYFMTGKLYLVALTAIVLLAVTAVEVVATRKLEWQAKPFDNQVLLLAAAVGLSTLFVSPNKIQAILSVNFGLVLVASLTVIYFFLSRLADRKHLAGLLAGSAVTSLFSVIFYFNPFAKASLPAFWSFLKNPQFNTLGGQLELAFYLVFCCVLAYMVFWQKVKKGEAGPSAVLFGSAAAIITLGLLLAGYALFKNRSSVLLPPFRLSWYAAVETLKSPLTALFGVGVDNFSAIYTRVKDVVYNQSAMWQINAFSLSRSAVFHILTETGLLGMVSFALLAFGIFRQQKIHNDKVWFYPSLVLLAVMLFFPITLPVVFLFYLVLAVWSAKEKTGGEGAGKKMIIDLANLPPVYISLSLVLVVLAGLSAWFLSQTFIAEYYFKKSLDGYVNNNARDLYDNQRQAIIKNPYIERFRVNFSQTNLLLANNMIGQAVEKAKQDKKDKVELSVAEQGTVSQAIQAAISEGKAAVQLNPLRASNWENLGVIYRNLINLAQGDVAVWTTASYQRAISLDPQNPSYRLNLGGIMYSFGNYEEASKLFEQTIGLKPDWPNAYYNLAWSDFKRGNIQNAVLALQTAINYLDPQKDAGDYKKALDELEEFKKKLPQTEAQASPSATPAPNKLTLPTPPFDGVDTKVKLPKEASPEAK